MISAFGIEHISKGLPRHLKDIQPVVSAQKRVFRGGQPLSRDDYAFARIKANSYGKETGRLNAEHQKKAAKLKADPKGLKAEVKGLEALRSATRSTARKGQLSRMVSRKAQDDNVQPFRTLP